MDDHRLDYLSVEDITAKQKHAREDRQLRRDWFL